MAILYIKYLKLIIITNTVNINNNNTNTLHAIFII